jgi:APA family basic amino acid/polyamine antiporter
MYAYTGWNASTYIAGEIRNPQRNLPLSVLLGTAFVTLLYLGLNATFLRAAPLSELSGKLEVGQVAATHIFGGTGGRIMSGLICAGLLSSLSAMTWVGPRVTVAMSKDFPFLAPLGRENRRGVPVTAMGLQTAMVLLLLATRSFETVLTYLQCALSLCSLLTVGAVFVLRIRQPDLPRPSKTWGYPVTPALFLGVNAWMLWHVLKAHPLESCMGLITLLAGPVLFAARTKSRPA